MDFGSLNIDGLENIINSLSQKDIEELSGIADSLLGSKGKNEDKNPPKQEKQDSFNFDPEMLKKISAVMGRLSKQKDDPRCELLKALKPMLSPQKQKKTDEAINMLRVISLLPIIDELKG